MPFLKAWHRAGYKRLRLACNAALPRRSKRMAYTAGVDVGSTQTKAVVIDEAKNIIGRALIDTGANVVLAAEQAFAKALESANVEEEEVEYVIGTGYGR